MHKKFLFLFLLLAAAAAVFFYKKYRVAPTVKFTELTLTDLTGDSVSLHQYPDKKLLVCFFATWCGPCVREIPSLLRAEQKLKSKGLRLLLISDEPLALLQSFENATGTQGKILHSTRKLNSYSIYTVPTTYLLNAKREVIWKKVGEEEWDSDEAIDKLSE